MYKDNASQLFHRQHTGSSSPPFPRSLEYKPVFHPANDQKPTLINLNLSSSPKRSMLSCQRKQGLLRVKIIRNSSTRHSRPRLRIAFQTVQLTQQKRLSQAEHDRECCTKYTNRTRCIYAEHGSIYRTHRLLRLSRHKKLPHWRIIPASKIELLVHRVQEPNLKCQPVHLCRLREAPD